MTSSVDLAHLRAQFQLPQLDDPNTWIDFDVTDDPRWANEITATRRPGAWYVEWDQLVPATGEVADRYYVGGNLTTLTEELTAQLRGALPAPGSPIKVRVCAWALRFAPPQPLDGAA